MKNVLLAVALAAATLATPAHAGQGPEVSRCEWIVGRAADNLWNLCYFFEMIPLKRWFH